MRKRHAIAILLGAAGVLLAALAGEGQERLGLAGRGDSLRLALLRTPQVQKELKLTDRQKARLAELEAESKVSKKRVESTYGKGEKGKAKARPGEPQSDEERIAREARESELDGLERRADERLAATLDARQSERLTQIVLRVQGPSAFVMPELIDKLGLTPDQVDAIREILGNMRGEQDQYKEVQKRGSELVKAGGEFELEKARKDQEKGQSRALAYKLARQAMPEIGRILTRHQRGLYSRMIGEPFELGALTDRDGQPLIDESADLKRRLLRQPPIQRELALTPSQRDQLARDTPALKVLDSGQRTRLNELELQAEGVIALTRPEMVQALRLDPEQLEQIQANLDGLVDESRRLRDALKAAPAEPVGDVDEATAKEQAKEQARKGSAQLRGEISRRIGTILTRRQNEQFRRMLGEPYDFSKLRPEPVDRR